MPLETMTPLERWLAVMNRQKPDRVPMDFWSTPEFAARLIRHMGLSRMSEKRLEPGLTALAGTLSVPTRLVQRYTKHSST